MAKDLSKQGKRDTKNNQDCTICMSRAVNCKTIECSHEFCYRCLSKWTRRNGTCPLCRQDVRKILYKKKVIQPDFLKIFDAEKIVLTEQNQINSHQHTATSLRIIVRPFLIWVPTLQGLPYFNQVNFSPMDYLFPVQ